ncbi:PAAR domain-containing protein [Methylovorus sp. MP688]|uniref:PAAR domain-containing protein n=1 Tax=Methylovorus sp. (strain MP688) TaxID=887061 RepID=UPI0011D04F83|nr:PAAR domain-containing protein [Methylovorus sp. MP688]
MKISRAYVVNGDKTTAGGRVESLPLPSPWTIGNEAADISCEGDKVWCPACDSYGVTKCIPPFRPMLGSDGRQINLDGDLCVCKCSVPPRLVARMTNYTAGFNYDAILKMYGCEEWLEYAGLKLSESIIKRAGGKVFQFKDSETGQPLSNRKVVIKKGGEVSEAVTDSDGKIDVMADDGQLISLFMVFTSPNKLLISGGTYDR